jgi:lipopolysaccharide transport system ATP-binding protein
MDDVSHKDGRTILFVSHNMGMINSLCNRAILLDAGIVLCDERVSDAISRYYNNGKSSPFALDYSLLPAPPGDEYAVLMEGCIEDKNGNTTGEVDIRETFYVKMKYHLKQDVPISPYANMFVYNSQGQVAFVTASKRQLPLNQAGVYEATCTIPGDLLNNDTYTIGLALTFTHNGIHVSFFEQNALTVTVREIIDETLEERRSGYSGAVPGVVRPQLDWTVRRAV